jgi:hypothetical protein
MSTGRPTKAQVVEALNKEFMGSDRSPHREGIIQSIADILVRAGLAEEPPQVGLHWVKRFGNANWEMATWTGREWNLVEVAPFPPSALPAVIGPLILPPKE